MRAQFPSEPVHSQQRLPAAAETCSVRFARLGAEESDVTVHLSDLAASPSSAHR